MIYRQFGSTGWQASVVGLGTWNLGNPWGELPESQRRALLAALG